MDISELFKELPIKIEKYKPVSGGDINKAYYLKTEESAFFIKVNDKNKYPDMLKKEADGLFELKKSQTIIVPEILEQGEWDDYQYLILEWIINRSPNKKMWAELGHSLAEMHQIKQAYFGWKENNYIGNLLQDNPKCSTWKELYGKYHIMPLAKALFEQKKFNNDDIKKIENFCNQIENIFPKEHPSLLHGDLWRGNCMFSLEKEKAVLIDPVVYYGNREIDLGLSLLFGGFDAEFYKAYQEIYLLENGWKERIPYTQLYPILFHAVIFGGDYIEEAKRIISQF